MSIPPVSKPTCFNSFLQTTFPHIMGQELGCIIGAGLPEDLIMKIIRNIIDRGKIQSELSSKITDYGITPLHIAVMRGEQTIVDALLALNSPLDSADINGCTPLHIAAMTGNAPLLNKMLAAADKVNQAIRRMRNGMRATAEEILKTLSPPQYPPTTVVGYYKDAQGALLPLTPEQLFKVVGFHHCPYAVATSDIHMEMWIKEGFVAEWAPIPLGDIPPLYFEKERCGDRDLGWGVRARRPIKAFEFLDIYGGICFLKNKDSIYGLGDVDAETYGTISSRINDGDPNCAFRGGFRDGKRLTFIQATRAIGLNESVWVHYGLEHPCKWGYYAFRPRADFFEFVESTDFLFTLKQFDQLQSGSARKDISSFPQEYLNCMALVIRINYIFETPAVLAQLLLNKQLKGSTCEEVLTYLSKRKNQNTSIKTQTKYLNAVIRLVQQMNAANDGEQSAAVLNYFVSLLGKYRVILVLQEIGMFVEAKGLMDWQNTQTQIEKRLLLKEQVLSFESDPKGLEKALKPKESLYQSLNEQKHLISQIEEAMDICFMPQKTESLISVLQLGFPLRLRR